MKTTGLTRNEIKDFVINRIGKDFPNFDWAEKVVFTEIKDDKIRKMCCFFYEHEGHKVVELQLALKSYGCFLRVETICLIDAEGDYLKNLKKDNRSRFDKLVKLTKKNIENILH